MIKVPNLKEMTHEQKDALIIQLIDMVNALNLRVNTLEEQLRKNSRNSSKPPSTDGIKRKPKSMRQTGGQVGGQIGHPGKTLKRVTHPDHTIIHRISTHCHDCGNAIDVRNISLASETRQVIDLPPIRIQVTEHRLEVAQCRCGKVHTAQFPDHITQAAQYGAHVKAAAVYLAQYQQLPVDRTAQALHDLFGLHVSAGTVQNHIDDAAVRLSATVQTINHTLRTAAVVHFDETSMHVGRTQQWLHSASTSNLTYYAAHVKRGAEALDAIGILPNFTGIAVHDGWKPYAGYECLHALCNAHHLRELIFIFETTKQAWAETMINLLRQAKTESDASLLKGKTTLSAQRVRYYLQQFQELLDQAWLLNPEQQRDPRRVEKRGIIKQSFAYNLIRRLERYANEVWRFIRDHRVPFDNNLAERDIRMPKLKQKISGCFRTSHGFESFCTIRSYLSTLRKQQQPLFHALVLAFSGNVMQPYLGAE